MSQLKIVSFIVVLALIGCNDRTSARSFREVTTPVEDEAVMPQADPHAAMQEMPDDDIHAAFRKGINAASGSGMAQMPDDDIHKKFKMGSMAGQEALMDSAAPAQLRWTTPSGWTETKGSGMRMATFTAGEGAAATETSIVSLAGAAGGMSANVSRWMGQINLSVPSDSALDAFIQQQSTVQTQSGLTASLINFTQLQKEQSAEVPSMIAAVIDADNKQIFIKMTGTKQAVSAQFEAFQALVVSIAQQ